MQKRNYNIATLTRRNSVVNNILHEASVLFWQKGYESTTMRDIASACGFESPNIYNYFKNKEQVLYEVLKRELEMTQSRLKSLEKDTTLTPSDKLRSFMRITLETNLGSEQEAGMLFDMELKNLSPRHRMKIVVFRDRYEDIFYTILREGTKRGDFNIPDMKIAGYTVFSIILRTRVWYSASGRLSPTEIADVMHDVVVNGFKTRA